MYEEPFLFFKVIILEMKDLGLEMKGLGTNFIEK